MPVRVCLYICYILILGIMFGHTKQMRHQQSHTHIHITHLPNTTRILVAFTLPINASPHFRQRFTINLCSFVFAYRYYNTNVTTVVIIIIVVAVFIAKIAVLSVFSSPPTFSWSFVVFVVAATDINQGVELEPEFIGSISNVTYPVGREAVLTCSVKNLGKYKVSVSNFSVLTLIHT